MLAREVVAVTFLDHASGWTHLNGGKVGALAEALQVTETVTALAGTMSVGRYRKQLKFGCHFVGC